MKIGDLELDNKYILAPMAGVTDLPFRLLCKEQGCSLMYTEMISAKGLYYGDKKTRSLIETLDEEKPIGIQIFGSDPKIMAKVVKEQINDMNFALVDINAGCPAPKIVKNGDGSALMKNPELLGEIVYAVAKESRIPVTVKIRSGWDDAHINAVEVAKIIEEAGANAVTVHGRTREQFYSGKSNWDIIKRVKEQLQIPVIGNGDVKSYKSAISLLDSTKCDGIMIGRGSLGNPWIFSMLINQSEKCPKPQEKIQTAIRHMEMLLEIKPEKVVMGEIRKHIGWYTKGLQGSAEIRNQINQTLSSVEVKDLLINYMKLTEI
ncbi:tRNA-U20-dihydrouridine synthase [Alkalibaculum bacchi]|uniref:tRNA-dihydrouridine synthase n=1 Tax=Alkalibaculum bacchi TaxID=645887 RepID=A0A366IAZ0_9FIRM|nr:tRNA dihydrouridine synthase DusB [Alkalibaculum bacchi]RBP67485.1 tRNA-U20-dihydrouridine synthase [Alkalibaculum bacchi]